MWPLTFQNEARRHRTPNRGSHISRRRLDSVVRPHTTLHLRPREQQQSLAPARHECNMDSLAFSMCRCADLEQRKGGNGRPYRLDEMRLERMQQLTPPLTLL